MRRLLILASIAILPCGCALSDFADRQAAWNARNGMAGMNVMPAVGRSASDRASDDEATRQRVKFGEDVENDEARKAGFGPSPTDGMSCTSTTEFVGSANSGTASSHRSCH